MAIIITFSGLVGTGKSVCARYLSSELYQRGLPVYYLRYRFISLKSFFTPKKQVKSFQFKEKPAKSPGETGMRFEKFTLHSPLRLLFTAPWYLLRAYLFFILINVRYPNDVVITDRYVYDHLAHYRLTDGQTAWIYRLFGKLLPKPQFPFVLYAGFEAVKQARPGYSDGYIQLNLENYRKLSILFPNTIFVDAEPVRAKAEAVLAEVNKKLEEVKSKK